MRANLDGMWRLLVLVAVAVICSEAIKPKKHHHNQSVAQQVRDRERRKDLFVKGPELREKGKICIGTNGRLSVPSNRNHHYRNLRDRFTNCTYVDGNLELTWLEDKSLDLSFLQYIREVTGYVLISNVEVSRVVLPRLQIIRGRTLFKMNASDKEYALFVSLSKMETLELPALRDVLHGSIGLFNNFNLCYTRTINWKEIISDPYGNFTYVYNFVPPERSCPPCHKSCIQGCWGEGPENCQKFSKEICSPQCYQGDSKGRCFGPNPRECCHYACAGGCTGPKNGDCIACRNFYDDGVCKDECPPMQKYNPQTYSWEPNPIGKYAYGATCVRNCPEHLLKDNGACVRTCPSQKKAVNGECVPCNGPCPKTCAGDIVVHAGNIDDFKDCTVIEGYLQILQMSLNGFQNYTDKYGFGEHYPAMHPDRLEVFSTVKQITGYLNVQANHSHFKNLSYFRNLEVIEGRVLTDLTAALYIVSTSLESLELYSLKKISAGTVVILENQNLCFVQDINWDKIKKSHDHAGNHLFKNAPVNECVKKNLICDEQCSSEGCWGTGDDRCLSCRHFQLNNVCIQNCSVSPGLYTSGQGECQPCHEQCGDTGCRGPEPKDCLSCRHFRDGPYCVSECPANKYAAKGSCLPCPSLCVDGCTGPRPTVGEGGCNSCELVVMNENATFERCLDVLSDGQLVCPDGYYKEYVGSMDQEFLRSLAGKAICRKCHPRCKKCTAYGFHEQVCQQCTNYKKGEQCEDECPMDHFPDNTTHECVPCHSECRGCSGPGPDNCLLCQNFKVYIDGGAPLNTTAFTCVTTCPPELKHRTFPDNADAYCSDKASQSQLLAQSTSDRIYIYLGTTLSLIFIIGATILLAVWRRRVKVKENTLKMAMTCFEDEPLTHSNVPPNVSKLRIIKQTEIRKGHMLGYGAFGAVYQGVWLPDGENNKIPIAIKVLHEETGCTTHRSKEFVDEASIMARVEHPNLLQLLAVCMTSQMMLITQLMPLGCLLDYVRKNRKQISSMSLLNWCTQISRGMAYLEEMRLVHRDLAARNVLVQTPANVKITDFGLAKLLDINEEEYKAEGGKMPIKWLALECIQHRRFTHKSDVWAFGVTVWEVLTFGGRPYNNVPASEVPELLEKGVRLEQPAIASIDAYVLMLKCWFLNAEERPCFKELADEFYKMSKDPGRYLAVPRDKFCRIQDDRESNRNVATTLETTESQSEGDEYLRPKSRSPLNLSNFTNDPFKTWRTNTPINSDGSSQYQNNLNQKLLKYSQNQALDPASLQTTHTDVSSVKYCGGESLKMQDKTGSDEYDSSRSQAQVGSVKLELPVDEDDYLVPSPQPNQNASAYVDLIDGKNPEGSSSQMYTELYKNNIDNPEYLMNNDAPNQTVGLPTVSEFVQATTPTTPTQVGFGNRRPGEEESDHEYYNDFDRLRRELQPLQTSKDGSIV